MNEVWKKIDIDGGDFDRYSVSNQGNVRSNGTKLPPGMLNPQEDAIGYVHVRLSGKSGKVKLFKVHDLVAHAFLGPKHRGLEINHIDTDKANNEVINLEYVSHLENIKHAYENGLGKGVYIPDKDAMSIFEMRHYKKMKYKEIAGQFGCTTACIGAIIRGVSRPYLKERWEASQP